MAMRKMRKSVKRRGHRVQGGGAMRKYRGKGHRGGKGMSGSKKHRKFWVSKYKPDHLGKRGFASKTGSCVKAINIGDVEKLAGDKKEIDLAEFGYGKVLGKGNLSKPLAIKASSFSKKAIEKIGKAKGKMLS